MISDKERIEELQKLLQKANRRIEKVEQELEHRTAMLDEANKKCDEANKKCDEANKKCDEANKKCDEVTKKYDETAAALRALVKSYPGIIKLGTELIQYINDHPDLPRADKERFLTIIASMQADMKTTQAFRFIARFIEKGSEKLPKPKKQVQEILDSTVNLVVPALRSINKRQEELGALVAVNGKAAEAASKEVSDNPALCAAARINQQPEPDVVETDPAPSPGRQVLKAKSDVKIEVLENPAPCCPHCDSKEVTYGKSFTECIRDLTCKLSELAALVGSVYRIGRCQKCDTVFLVYDDPNTPLPVLPHRTVAQHLAIEFGIANAMGIAFNKLEELTFKDGSQLGHETLNENAHTWINDSGAFLLKRLHTELLSQHTVEMDETPLQVLQSSGLGVCKPTEETPRKKDYIGVLSTPSQGQRRIAYFDYLGSRGTEAISRALEGLEAKVLVTDGYAVYDGLCEKSPALKHQSCIAHLRRVILDALNIEAINNVFKGKTVDEAIEEAKTRQKEGSPLFLFCSVLQGFSKIYGNELSLKQHRRPEQSEEQYLQAVLESRQTYSKALMENIDTIMVELAKTHVIGSGKNLEAANKGSLVDKAVVYYMRRRESFRTFIDDPQVPPDSNAAELAVRALAVLRKATDFKQSQEYTKSLCAWLTLHETAKANGIENPVQWLVDYGRALYMHRASVTLTHEVVNRGRKLDSKLMGFNPGSEKGFDFEPWLPWNYAKRQK